MKMYKELTLYYYLNNHKYYGKLQSNWSIGETICQFNDNGSVFDNETGEGSLIIDTLIIYIYHSSVLTLFLEFFISWEKKSHNKQKKDIIKLCRQKLKINHKRYNNLNHNSVSTASTTILSQQP